MEAVISSLIKELTKASPQGLAASKALTRGSAGWLVGATWLYPSTLWMLDFSPPAIHAAPSRPGRTGSGLCGIFALHRST